MNYTLTTTTQDFFVVQRCWFDGPHVNPPIDFLRLLTLPQAEAVALQSAHAYAALRQAVVRTILVPPSSQRGSAYAYAAAGNLFWVRKVVATVATQSARVPSNPRNTDATRADPPTALPPSIHAVLTKGVIGGTGNVNSRRGSEVETGRVFVGPSSVVSQWALHTAQSLRHLPDTYVTSLLPGLPEASYPYTEMAPSESVLLQGWPDLATWYPAGHPPGHSANQHQHPPVVQRTHQSDHSSHGMETDEPTERVKRNENEGWIELDVVRPAKRQCYTHTATTFGNATNSTINGWPIVDSRMT
jgi:hypothetical protein